MRWRKSYRSNVSKSCVEVTDSAYGSVLVRDSKRGDVGPVLTIGQGEWRAFVGAVGMFPDQKASTTTLVIFGSRWDAPNVEDRDLAVEVPVPVGRLCLSCVEPITATDRGFMQVVVRIDDTGEKAGSVEPLHLECQLRMIFGSVEHLEGSCRCHGGEGVPERGTPREQALEVLEYLNRMRARDGRGPL